MFGFYFRLCQFSDSGFSQIPVAAWQHAHVGAAARTPPSHDRPALGHMVRCFLSFPNVEDIDKNTLRVLILRFPRVLFGLLYYGITIYTTKLFQSGDECHGGVRPANVTSAGSGFAENSTEPGITNPGCRHLTPDDYLDIVITSFSELPGAFYFGSDYFF